MGTYLRSDWWNYRSDGLGWVGLGWVNPTEATFIINIFVTYIRWAPGFASH